MITTSTPASIAPYRLASVGSSILVEQVDADRRVVALLGEEDLDEVRGDRVLDQLLGIAQPVHLRERGQRPVEHRLGKVLRDDARRDGLVREGGERAADVTALVAGAQARRHDRLGAGAGDHAELPLGRDRAGQLPARNPGAHATLDDPRKPHASPLEPPWPVVQVVFGERLRECRRASPGRESNRRAAEGRVRSRRVPRKPRSGPSGEGVKVRNSRRGAPTPHSRCLQDRRGARAPRAQVPLCRSGRAGAERRPHIRAACRTDVGRALRARWCHRDPWGQACVIALCGVVPDDPLGARRREHARPAPIRPRGEAHGVRYD